MSHILHVFSHSNIGCTQVHKVTCSRKKIVVITALAQVTGTREVLRLILSI